MRFLRESYTQLYKLFRRVGNDSGGYMKKTTKRILCGFLSAMMLSTVAVESVLRADGAAATSSATADGVTFKNVTGKYDTSALREENFNSSVLKNEDVAPTYETRTVLVELKGESLSDRADGAVTDYLGSWAGDLAKTDISSEQDAFLKALKKKGISYSLKRSYDTVLNGVAIEVNTKYVSEIKKMSGVNSVVITTSYNEPTVATTASSGVTTNQTEVYATGIYDSSKYAEKYSKGMVVAILDTGLDYTHAAFQDFKTEGVTGAWSEDYVKQMLEEKSLAAESLSGSLSVNDVYISEKVPFAYDYADSDTDVYPSYSNHGTHVAGIIGGYDESGYTDADGKHVNTPFIGVAPDAQLVICKVFTDDLDDPEIGGATTEAIVAALDDCVALGVDVINMSLGSSCGFTTTNDGDDEGELLNRVYSSIQEAGISLVCAASNDYSAGYGGVYGTNLAENPDAGTVGSPSTFAAALSVASIDGKKAPYMIANAGDEDRESVIFFEESRDLNGNAFDFVEQMQTKYGQTEFEYVLVPGVGDSYDYTSSIKKLFKDDNGNSLKRIAVVQRGDATFQKKVEIAMEMGAAGIIIYNNVAGSIRMNLGEIDDPIPAISVTMNAGAALKLVEGNIGTLTLSAEYAAGPFMSEFSSWGPTPDLKLKPEITAHGGEITSTVPGGYGEQSGTSMASPNTAGFTALVRSYIEKDLGITTATEINRLASQLTMSTASTVYDQDGLPYSPRKQGAGVARLENVIDKTQAYLSTDVKENDYRPKIELGDDKDRTGSYTLSFNVTNFSSSETLTFKPTHIAMTETLSSDGLTVAEQAHLLNKAETTWFVGANKLAANDKISVEAGETLKITVKLVLTEEEKAYIDESFKNGMYVEGFLQLLSETEGQCDLSIPFLGFYGDWEDAPMLDYTAFEVAEDEQNSAVPDELKKKASIWETLPYNSYYNEKYILPMGTYSYLLPDSEEPMYVNEEYCSVSRYNNYYGEGAATNYLTTTQIKAVYAGLLRNARVVRYSMYNVDTGEVILQNEILNRVSKAYSGGGSATPANVELELSPEDLELVANGKYRIDMEFFRNEPEEGETAKEENTYSFSYTVDYEAPVLDDVRIRYYNYKDGNVEKQRIYLDVDVYDNHYAQALMLCYPTVDSDGQTKLMLATDYPTPVRNPKKNDTTTVSIEITDIYEKHGGQLYLQVDDYAVNSCLYQLDIQKANASVLPEGGAYELGAGEENITLGIYDTHKVSLSYSDTYTNADPSNFLWSAKNPGIADVKNGEIVGLSAGTTEISVSNRKGGTKTITVTVTNEVNASLPKVPSISFGLIKQEDGSLAKAEGSVAVNAGEKFTLTVETNPWYHPMTDLRLKWSSLNDAVASVDQNGNVLTKKDGTATISAVLERKSTKSDGTEVWTETLYSANVSLRVQDEFTVSGYTLTDYNGLGGEVVIPTDLNVMYIGEEAFKDNTNITKIVIPASVMQISARAFMNCTALEEVYFVSENHREDEDGKEIDYGDGVVIDWSDLSIIYQQAFYNCPNLKKVDLANVKKITIDAQCFAQCPNLDTVVSMSSIGTMHHQAFMNCGFKSVDLTGLHMSGMYVFQGCNEITEIKTAKFTSIGDYMFAGCTALEEVVISTPKVGVGAFSNCVNLTSVRFDDGLAAGDKNALGFDIGANAFENCGKNAVVGLTVDFGDENIRSLGDRAFASANLSKIDFSKVQGLKNIGANVFAGVASMGEIVIGDGVDFENVQINGAAFSGKQIKVASGSTRYAEVNGVIYTKDMSKLLFVNESVNGSFTMPDTVTSIANYAFANSAITELTFSKALQTIGEYAFVSSKIAKVNFNGNESLTKIPVGAFQSSALCEIVLPDSVKTVESYAFSDSALNKFVGNGVETFGNRVFESCTAMQEIALPESLKEIGNATFYNCSNLTKVTLPAVESLGSYTFRGAKKLQEVVFGEDATTTGMYTFLDASVKKVVFEGTLITEIEEGFLYGVKGVSVWSGKAENTLPANVTTIGDYAFHNTEIAELQGIEHVENFGYSAFYNAKFESLNLADAKTIGNMAFASQTASSYTSVTMPNVQEIGRFAFLNGSFSTVTIPATVTKIGEGAFAACANLTSFVVENENFFVDNGALYRKLSTDGEYELAAYPSGLIAAGEAGARSYAIKEGTLRVQAYAFYELKDGAIDSITLPYSVNTIGDCAFYGSGIHEYVFESIEAPILEAVYREEIETAIADASTIAFYKGYYYSNFETLLYNYTHYVGDESPLSMKYPSNGKGYDNHIYKLYFGERTEMGVYMEDLTRQTLKEIEDANAMLKDLESWTTNVKPENKAKVEALAEKVKAARANFNLILNNASQAQYMTDEVSATLMNVESKIRAAKTAYGIQTNISSLQIAEGSTHRTTYTVGEHFDMTGLKLMFVYDDYSTELVPADEMTLLTTDELRISTSYVEVKCRGKKVRIIVTIQSADAPADSSSDSSVGESTGGKKKGCGSFVSGTGVSAFALAAASLVACRKRKSKQTQEDETQN